MQWTRKELWLCVNWRFRMHSRLARNCGYAGMGDLECAVDYHTCAFFLHWFSNAISIICNLVKVHNYRNKRSNWQTNNFACDAYFCRWSTLVDREPKAFIMNSLEEWKQSWKPLYIWIGFWKTEHTQDQQNGVAYGQRNSLTAASSLYGQ